MAKSANAVMIAAEIIPQLLKYDNIPSIKKIVVMNIIVFLFCRNSITTLLITPLWYHKCPKKSRNKKSEGDFFVAFYLNHPLRFLDGTRAGCAVFPYTFPLVSILGRDVLPEVTCWRLGLNTLVEIALIYLSSRCA